MFDNGSFLRRRKRYKRPSAFPGAAGHFMLDPYTRKLLSQYTFQQNLAAAQQQQQQQQMQQQPPRFPFAGAPFGSGHPPPPPTHMMPMIDPAQFSPPINVRATTTKASPRGSGFTIDSIIGGGDRKSEVVGQVSPAGSSSRSGSPPFHPSPIHPDNPAAVVETKVESKDCEDS